MTTTNNSPSQDYTHLDNQITLSHVTPGFKPFPVLIRCIEIADQYQYLGNCPPTPNPTLTLTCCQLTVVELGEGQMGSCPDTDIDLKLQCF